jgi:hypothetical protein
MKRDFRKIKMNFKTGMFYLIFFISAFQIIFAQNISTVIPASDISTDRWETRFVKHLNNQAVWISKIKDEYRHREYIQLAPGQFPVLFYEHQRGIHPVLGHLNRYILVNDEPVYDASEVHIVDLNNGKIGESMEVLLTNIFILWQRMMAEVFCHTQKIFRQMINKY